MRRFGIFSQRGRDFLKVMKPGVIYWEKKLKHVFLSIFVFQEP